MELESDVYSSSGTEYIPQKKETNTEKNKYVKRQVLKLFALLYLF